MEHMDRMEIRVGVRFFKGPGKESAVSFLLFLLLFLWSIYSDGRNTDDTQRIGFMRCLLACLCFLLISGMCHVS